MFKSFLKLGVCALVLAGGALIAPSASAQAAYSCGPNFETYVVRSLDGREGAGIRCVKRSNGSSSSIKVPAFAWYGEGSWYGSTCKYRHVGQAYFEKVGSSAIKGYASDISGNGECANANYPGNLKIKIVDADRIQVTGAGWNEEWTRTTEVNYVPLAAPTTCGKWFDQYRAISTSDYPKVNSASKANPAHSGIRCVMKAGPSNTTWFGAGSWDGKAYSHLATGSTKGYGASDFCKAGDSYCSNFAYGAIRRTISPKTKLPVVNGWNETWLRMK